jgi:hypothetical protein
MKLAVGGGSVFAPQTPQLGQPSRTTQSLSTLHAPVAASTVCGGSLLASLTIVDPAIPVPPPPAVLTTDEPPPPPAPPLPAPASVFAFPAIDGPDAEADVLSLPPQASMSATAAAPALKHR